MEIIEHFGIFSDELKREGNIKSGNKLCSRCSGTGNECFSMYKKCSACNGSGIYNEQFDYLNEEN